MSQKNEMELFLRMSQNAEAERQRLAAVLVRLEAKDAQSKLDALIATVGAMCGVRASEQDLSTTKGLVEWAVLALRSRISSTRELDSGLSHRGRTNSHRGMSMSFHRDAQHLMSMLNGLLETAYAPPSSGTW